MERVAWTEAELRELGYEDSAMLARMVERMVEWERRGIRDREYLLKRLRREFGEARRELSGEGERAGCAEAIEADGAEARENLELARKALEPFLCLPVVKRAVLLPDACPAGPGMMPVGSAIEVAGAIIPSAHSSDLCCSVHATFYRGGEPLSVELEKLMGATRFGKGQREKRDWVEDPVLDEPVWGNRFLERLHDLASAQMADQGDGNHFAFLGEVVVEPRMLAMLRLTGHQAIARALGEAEGEVLRVLVTHHGSRGLGSQVYQRGLEEAVRQTKKRGWVVDEFCSWLDVSSAVGEAYVEALKYVGRWTLANHRSIHRRFLERLGGDGMAEVGNAHNYVWSRDGLYVHGKGATPAWLDRHGRPRLGLIPLNMAEPILMVLGGHREAYLSFAPHGAGRNLSRAAFLKKHRDPARRERLMAELAGGTEVRWYQGRCDFSEMPLAYKPAGEVRRQIEAFGLAEVVAEIQPRGCVMAGMIDRDREVEVLSPKQLRQIEHRAERRKDKQRGWRGCLDEEGERW